MFKKMQLDTFVAACALCFFATTTVDRQRGGKNPSVLCLKDDGETYCGQTTRIKKNQGYVVYDTDDEQVVSFENFSTDGEQLRIGGEPVDGEWLTDHESEKVKITDDGKVLIGSETFRLTATPQNVTLLSVPKKFQDQIDVASIMRPEEDQAAPLTLPQKLVSDFTVVTGRPISSGTYGSVYMTQDESTVVKEMVLLESVDETRLTATEPIREEADELYIGDYCIAVFKDKGNGQELAFWTRKGQFAGQKFPPYVLGLDPIEIGLVKDPANQANSKIVARVQMSYCASLNLSHADVDVNDLIDAFVQLQQWYVRHLSSANCYLDMKCANVCYRDGRLRLLDVGSFGVEIDENQQIEENLSTWPPPDCNEGFCQCTLRNQLLVIQHCLLEYLCNHERMNRRFEEYFLWSNTSALTLDTNMADRKKVFEELRGRTDIGVEKWIAVMKPTDDDFWSEMWGSLEK